MPNSHLVAHSCFASHSLIFKDGQRECLHNQIGIAKRREYLYNRENPHNGTDDSGWQLKTTFAAYLLPV